MGVVSVQLHPRPAFLPIFDYPGVTANMSVVGSAYFRLQKCSSETYEWRHGHYVHFFTVYGKYIQKYKNTFLGK